MNFSGDDELDCGAVDKFPYTQPFVPEFMIKKEVGNIPFDQPYILSVVEDDERDDWLKVWVDKEGSLFVRKDAEVESVEGGEDIDLPGDDAIIMRVYEQRSGYLKMGYVVDMRFVAPNTITMIDDCDMPFDQEAMSEWLDMKKNGTDIRACIYNKGFEDIMEAGDEYVVVGDVDFYDAADYLARTIDAMISATNERYKETPKIPTESDKKSKSKTTKKIEKGQK